MSRFYTNSPSSGRPTPSTRAFTLLEIVAVIAIIGILGGTIAPLAFQLFTSKRGEVTVDRLEEFKKAIIGNPFVIGDDVRSSFGYIGDIGNLPANLQDLYIRGVQPTYSYNSTLKTGAGWRGPYINPDIIENLATLRLDAYMQQLVYSTTAFTDTPTPPNTGASVVGSLTSTGPNRTQGGAVADDRNVYIFQSETFSTVSGFLKDTAGNGVAGVSVTMNYPVNGTINYTPELSPSYAIATAPLQRSVVTANGTTYPIGYFEFRNIPYGNRSITIEPKLVYAPGSARTLDDTGDCSDGINDDIVLYVTNLSNAPISVVRVKVWFDISTNPSANYRKLWLGSSSSTGCGNKQSGSPEPFSTTPTINGITGGGPSGQSHVVRVQSPYTHIPDLRLQSYPSGDTVRMRIQDFQRTGSDSLNVSGIPFKVEFFSTWTGGPGGSGTLISTIYFTPNAN